jgi:hypothetical protein
VFRHRVCIRAADGSGTWSDARFRTPRPPRRRTDRLCRRRERHRHGQLTCCSEAFVSCPTHPRLIKIRTVQIAEAEREGSLVEVEWSAQSRRRRGQTYPSRPTLTRGNRPPGLPTSPPVKPSTLIKFREACVRCPLLRVDPDRLPRLEEIHANLLDRLHEAKEHGWLGEVAAIETTMAAAAQKLQAMRDQASRGATIHLGMPDIRRTTARSSPDR